MAELNFGEWGMFLPGFRYERTDARMNGLLSIQPDENSIGGVTEPVVGNDTSATRVDEFLLPMIHFRLKPTKFAYVHLAYTQSLSRPGLIKFPPIFTLIPKHLLEQFKSKNPELRTELGPTMMHS